MPRAIDETAFSELKVLDINNPPTRSIPHEAFPKALYLHPKDKTREHRTKIVQTAEEMDEALAQGWKTKPHMPEAVVEDLSEHFEAEPLKRGPGRPRNDAA